MTPTHRRRADLIRLLANSNPTYTLDECAAMAAAMCGVGTGVPNKRHPGSPTPPPGPVPPGGPEEKHAGRAPTEAAQTGVL